MIYQRNTLLNYLNKIFSDETFIPTSMRKHVQILYCVNNRNHKEKVNNFKKNSWEFDPCQTMT